MQTFEQIQKSVDKEFKQINDDIFLHKREIENLKQKIRNITKKSESLADVDTAKIKEYDSDIIKHESQLKELNDKMAQLLDKNRELLAEKIAEETRFRNFKKDLEQRDRELIEPEIDELKQVLTHPSYINAMMIQQRQQEQQRRQQTIEHNKLPISIPLPPYGDDEEYKSMIYELVSTVGNPGVTKLNLPTETKKGFVNSKVLAMYCHADKEKYKKLADKLKEIFPESEKTLYEDNGAEYNIESILDDVCSYLGYSGGRRSKTKTKTSKYIKQKITNTRKGRKHSRRYRKSRRQMKSRRYRKSKR
jgi:hypothetical protein